tara:strand:+ start:486 stop:1025 length:540 start_codon:yes stop_codon:yes gene_type:complete
MTNKPTLGTLIEGTLRTEDLIESFADELKMLTSKTQTHNHLLQEASQILEALLKSHQYLPMKLEEEASSILNDLSEAINQYCLPYTYFGAHPDDGADFGFWIEVDNLNEAIEDSKKITETMRDEGKLHEDEELWLQECDCQEDDCIGKHGYILREYGQQPYLPNTVLMDHNREIIWSVV